MNFAVNTVQILETCFIAALVSYLVTPFVRALALRLDYVDHPKDNKVHSHPTPLLGGVAIFAAFIIAIITKEYIISLYPVKAIILGASILLVIGLIDDKMGMMPNFKLLGQFLAAMIIIKAGLRIEFIKNYYLSVIITYIWIVGITNAFNLLDNMNGLSAGIAGISAAFFGIIAFREAQPVVSAIALAIAGSSFGFLKYNFPKAKIFMGDSGSLVLGYLLAAVALMGSWRSHILTTSLMIPTLILGYPIFDTALVSLIRIFQKRSIFEGGKDHSSHRLALLGLKRYGAVLLIYAICILLGIAAVIVSRVRPGAGLTIVSLAVIFMLALGIRLSLVDTGRFGRKKGLNGIKR